MSIMCELFGADAGKAAPGSTRSKEEAQGVTKMMGGPRKRGREQHEDVRRPLCTDEAAADRWQRPQFVWHGRLPLWCRPLAMLATVTASP